MAWRKGLVEETRSIHGNWEAKSARAECQGEMCPPKACLKWSPPPSVPLFLTPHPTITHDWIVDEEGSSTAMITWAPETSEGYFRSSHYWCYGNSVINQDVKFQFYTKQWPAFFLYHFIARTSSAESQSHGWSSTMLTQFSFLIQSASVWCSCGKKHSVSYDLPQCSIYTISAEYSTETILQAVIITLGWPTLCKLAMHNVQQEGRRKCIKEGKGKSKVSVSRSIKSGMWD